MVAPSVPRLRNRLAADRTIRSRVCSLCSAGYRIVSLKDYMHHLIALVKETSGHFKSSIEFSRGHEYQCRLAFPQHYASLSHEFSLRSSASPDNNACHLLLRITLDPGYVAHQTHNDSVRNRTTSRHFIWDPFAWSYCFCTGFRSARCWGNIHVRNRRRAADARPFKNR
jgi:hypothetical protein